MGKVTLVIFIIGLGVMIKQAREYDELNSKYKLYTDLYNTLATDMKQDCNNVLNAERGFQRQVGCYNTIETLCMNTKKPKTCIEDNKFVCGEI